MAARDAGSPITIDGGGSVSIEFDDAVYEPGTNPDYHCCKNTRISKLTITNSSKGVVDLSTFLTGDLSLCQIEISHQKPKGMITITALPVGIYFSGKAFKKNHPHDPKPYFNENSTIAGVDITYDGGSISFDKNAVRKGKVKVYQAKAKPRV
jgi:hypothetical protein